MGKEREGTRGQAGRGTEGPSEGLTTGPQVHGLPVWVLPQHFWG